MSDYVPPPLREGYLRRFAVWLCCLWVPLSIGMVVNPDLASDPWLAARLAIGGLLLAALLALVRVGPNDT